VPGGYKEWKLKTSSLSHSHDEILQIFEDIISSNADEDSKETKVRTSRKNYRHPSRK
jgi:hypothetical protein